MKRLSFRLLITALTFILGVLAVFLWARHRTQLLQNVQLSSRSKAEDKGHVDFSGVSFVYDPELAFDVKSELRPKSIDAKLCDVVPQHIAFRLRYAAPDPEADSFFLAPEIHIYNIAEYKKAFAQFDFLTKSNNTLNGIEDYQRAMIAAEQITVEPATEIEEVHTLSTLLSQKPLGDRLARVLWKRDSLDRGKIPTLPIFEATQNFYAHVKYVNFRNGSGILFLTHYSIDQDFIRNHGLAYVFQGITDDGKYYVSAAFPVKAPILQDILGDAEILKKYHLDDEHMFSQRFQQGYKHYVKDTKSALEHVTEDEFEPALPLFEELIRSLSVSARN